jgi:hypothetical protein
MDFVENEYWGLMERLEAYKTMLDMVMGNLEHEVQVELDSFDWPDEERLRIEAEVLSLNNLLNATSQRLKDFRRFYPLREEYAKKKKGNRK